MTPVAGTSPFVALPGSATTLDDLGATIVRALVASDTTRLAGVRLSEQEYHDLVWPKLPLSRMGSNYPFAFSWSDLQLRNGRALRRYLGRFRARALRGTATQCDGKREQYADVVIVHDCHVVVADERGGAESMQLFRSAVLLRGGYKIFRYDD